MRGKKPQSTSFHPSWVIPHLITWSTICSADVINNSISYFPSSFTFLSFSSSPFCFFTSTSSFSPSSNSRSSHSSCSLDCTPHPGTLAVAYLQRWVWWQKQMIENSFLLWQCGQTVWQNRVNDRHRCVLFCKTSVAHFEIEHLASYVLENSKQLILQCLCFFFR